MILGCVMNWGKVFVFSVVLYILQVFAIALAVYLGGAESLGNVGFIIFLYAISLMVGIAIYAILGRGQAIKPYLHALAVFCLNWVVGFSVLIIFYYQLDGFVYPLTLIVFDLFVSGISAFSGVYLGVKFKSS